MEIQLAKMVCLILVPAPQNYFLYQRFGCKVSLRVCAWQIFSGLSNICEKAKSILECTRKYFTNQKKCVMRKLSNYFCSGVSDKRVL